MGSDSTYPKPLEQLITLFRRLPGIGRRTAERLALSLLDWSEGDLIQFGQVVGTLRERVLTCSVCGNLSDAELCRICAAHNRDRSVICVVEHAAQIAVIENSARYRGLYHVLGGKLMPLEGKGPEDLRVEELRERLADGTVKELIIATSPDVEGEATAHFVAEEFAETGVTVSRIASGVPVGSDLSFADSATMAIAIDGRRLMTD